MRQQNARFSFRKDHVMLIDGEPFFPAWRMGSGSAGNNGGKAEILADAGFNTARCAADQIDDFCIRWADGSHEGAGESAEVYGQRAFRTLGQDVPERNAEISEAPFPDRLLQYG